MKTVDTDVEIIKTFKSSASATTRLLKSGQELFVRKTFPKNLINKMLFQYRWYSEFEHLPFIPKLIKSDSYASKNFYDMEYISDSVTFSDYCRTGEQKKCEHILNQVLDVVSEKIHGPGRNIYEDPKALENYIQSKLIEKINMTRAKSKAIESLLSADEIEINGEVFLNFDKIKTDVFNNTKLMKSLSVLSDNPLHGDLTLENVLVTEKRFYIIDPNNENLPTVLVDYSKILQSLDCKYEIYLIEPDSQVTKNSICYPQLEPTNYSNLLKLFSKRIATEFDEEFTHNLQFHVAIQLARLLPYLVEINHPAQIIFYAELIKNLNRFARK